MLLFLYALLGLVCCISPYLLQIPRFHKGNTYTPSPSPYLFFLPPLPPPSSHIGIVTADQRRRLHLHKDNGLVRDVFKLQHMIQLIGNVGLGHVRYPTAGASSNVQEAQPFVTNIPFGICLCHNGNITNAKELSQQLATRYTVSTDSDSELLLSIYADELLRQMWGGDKEGGKDLDHSVGGLTLDVIFNACRGLMGRARGGYAALVLINGYGVLAFRDPWGIRPLCYGSRSAKQFLGTSKKDWCVASESVALECQEFDLHGDVLPGQAVFISLKGELTMQMCHNAPILAPCIFEYVYFGRPDSIIDGVSVYAARKAMGDKLAEKIRSLHDVSEIDVIVPVPETSRISALQCAIKLGVTYEEGLNKNRYIARTFIMPGQQKRKKNVRKKLNPCHGVFEDKNVMLVDDSIVRGTTSEQIVQMVRAAGAKKVFFCSASPAIRYPNVYGIDMPVQAELIAYGRDELEIAKAISADWLVYQVCFGGRGSGGAPLPASVSLPACPVNRGDTTRVIVRKNLNSPTLPPFFPSFLFLAGAGRHDGSCPRVQPGDREV